MRLIIAAFLFLFAMPAHAQQWWEAETDHFIVKSRSPEADAREFAIELERFDTALRALQNLPVGSPEASRANKLTVYRFGNDRDIARMAGASGSGIAGFYVGRAGASVAFAPARKRINTSIKSRSGGGEIDALAVLKHEYTHYFMMQHFPAAYPRWYVEGYAEMMATIYYKDDLTFHVGDPPQHRAYQVLQMNQFRLREMLDARHRLSGYDAIQHYGTGWLLSHYLSFDPARLAQLHEYLLALGTGEDSLAAAERIFGDLSRMDRELRQYRRGSFPGYDVKLAAFDESRIRMRPLSSAEEALIDEEMRLRLGGLGKKDGERIAAGVQRKTASFASDPHAMIVQGWAMLAAEDYAGAERQGAAIVAADPQSVEGYLIGSEAAVERIKDDPAQAETARTLAARAAELDRADPRPLILYYYSYLEAKQEPPEAAIIALETAFATSGSDSTYRILLARQLLIEDRLDEARTVLQPIAFQGHNQGDDLEKEEQAGKDGKPQFSMTRLLRLMTERDRDGALAEIQILLDDDDEEEA